MKDEQSKRGAAAAVDRAAVRRKLSRLKELFLNEVIDLDEYKRDYESLTALLAEVPSPHPLDRPNFEAVEAFLAQDFRKMCLEILNCRLYNSGCCTMKRGSDW